ncbi:GtrA family protein [Corynebacterium yudongzhengii]|uniref:GtrA family protein n=1 Tax=Corynebacterium yudongzhengii TaxID=2080740 RepID=A0A2U1T5L4_9CORY|nr:GtrA family protein [Corynebacterium yudongzhengii]PWC01272.1 GtrA family protein [Corynebacterium yudongzhengii]
MDAGHKRSDSLRIQAARFTTAGIAAAVIDLVVTWVLQVAFEVLGTVGARTVGWVLGTLFAYYLNRRWTFSARGSKRTFSATMLVYVLTYAVNITLYRLLFPVLDEQLELNVNVSLLVAFIVAQAVVTVLNFVVQRWLIFRRG